MRIALRNTLRLSLCLLSALAIQAICPAARADVRRPIRFPDLPGYKTLACDLHMHTVFSDGNVWPTVRVAEAWRQGLDAIAITDHVEYHPHQADLPTKLNRPYELAEELAKQRNILLIRGAEITRDTPPGHFNAVFVNDVGPLNTPDLLEAVKRARGQGAFVFWNHHAWQGEKKGQWLDVHTTMFQNGWLQALEVANGSEYYPQAHQWCLDKKLAMVGNTDIHDPDLRRESTSQDHRTMTLVFAKERSIASIKEALEAGRTVVWCKDRLIGREELLSPFFAACVQVGKPIEGPKKSWTVEVRNNCQADICLEPTGKGSPGQVVVPAGCIALVKVPATDSGAPTELKCMVKNFIVAPNRGLAAVLKLPAT